MASNFTKYPEIRIRGYDEHCYRGWGPITGKLLSRLAVHPALTKIIAVDCYQGVDDEEILGRLVEGLKPGLLIRTRDLMLPEEVIEDMTYPDVTDDRIFGFITRRIMTDFIDPLRIELAQKQLRAFDGDLAVVYGPGAALIEPEPALLLYADMTRWEIQLRMRNKATHNLGLGNSTESIEKQYKRGYFVDWRVCDRHKKVLMNRWHFVLDTNKKGDPVMITGEAFRESMKQAVGRPFSVVPYFDAGPWGGQWMKETLGLDTEMPNYAWCFNCVPEENSLLLRFGDTKFETPSVNLVFSQPRKLLGDPVHARFGDEFPIRFDFLDTMQGGNLSLQVHPLTEYIRENFGIHYTQDESYYLVDVAEGSSVYLGLREDADNDTMIRQLRESEDHGSEFPAEDFVNKWPAKKHDHFLVPGGTIHCSGRNCLVLEISSTPYIFTFKLWDWGRMGLDGKPRPINIERGVQNIQWDRTTSWVRENLVNRFEELGAGDGWREETTGLHEREFIETRRHWFSKKVHHHTRGGVNVIALVEGREVVVESPEGSFEPCIVHYAEVFIVPAAVGEYTIRPYGESEGTECATIKAYVRVNS